MLGVHDTILFHDPFQCKTLRDRDGCFPYNQFLGILPAPLSVDWGKTAEMLPFCTHEYRVSIRSSLSDPLPKP